MKDLAYKIMEIAANQRYHGIKIKATHHAVCHVWMNPPAPFKAMELERVNMKDLEAEKDGKKEKPCPGLDETVTEICLLQMSCK